MIRSCARPCLEYRLIFLDLHAYDSPLRYRRPHMSEASLLAQDGHLPRNLRLTYRVDNLQTRMECESRGRAPLRESRPCAQSTVSHVSHVLLGFSYPQRLIIGKSARASNPKFARLKPPQFASSISPFSAVQIVQADGISGYTNPRALDAHASVVMRPSREGEPRGESRKAMILAVVRVSVVRPAAGLLRSLFAFLHSVRRFLPGTVTRVESRVSHAKQSVGHATARNVQRHAFGAFPLFSIPRISTASPGALSASDGSFGGII